MHVVKRSTAVILQIVGEQMVIKCVHSDVRYILSILDPSI